MHSNVKLCLDLGPLLVFFTVLVTVNIKAATVVLMVLTLLSLAITYALEKRISPMPLVSGIAVGIFGGMSLWLNDDFFIKIKPTVVNVLFAAILLGGAALKKPLLKYALQSAMQMREEGWYILSYRWGFFFLFLALLNECIWRNFSAEFWAGFKLFGMFPLTLLFSCSQIPLIKKHAIET